MYLVFGRSNEKDNSKKYEFHYFMDIIVSFAKLVYNGLWPVWGKQRALYTQFLNTQTSQEIIKCKIRSYSDLCTYKLKIVESRAINDIPTHLFYYCFISLVAFFFL